MVDIFPMIEHNTQNNVTAMNDFTGRNVWVKSFYSECAPELERQQRKLDGLALPQRRGNPLPME